MTFNTLEKYTAEQCREFAKTFSVAASVTEHIVDLHWAINTTIQARPSVTSVDTDSLWRNSSKYSNRGQHFNDVKHYFEEMGYTWEGVVVKWST